MRNITPDELEYLRLGGITITSIQDCKIMAGLDYSKEIEHILNNRVKEIRTKKILEIFGENIK